MVSNRRTRKAASVSAGPFSAASNVRSGRSTPSIVGVSAVRQDQVQQAFDFGLAASNAFQSIVSRSGQRRASHCAVNQKKT